METPMPRAETVTLWMERLQRFEQSQMTVAQFCAAESVSQPSFYNWKRKLRSSPDPKALAVAKFVPVSFQPAPDCPTASHTSATIELPGGVRIRIEVPIDSQPNPLPTDQS